MKKYLFSALAMGLVLTSCQSDEPFAPGEGGEKQVTFTLNVPGELGTRAAAGANQSDKGGATNQGADQIKYTLVLQANNDTQILKHDQATVSGTTATFKPTVVLGREYTITAYASLKDAWNGVNPIAITNSFNDESKDAYFKTLKHNFANDDLQPLTLTRPFGKLRLVAEDYDPAKTKVESVKITYANPQEGTFNATTEAFTIATENVAGTTKPFGYYEAADATGAHAIFAEYLPAPKTGEYPVTFTVEVKYDGSTETYSRTFNDIPVRRNALTTLKGAFFTAGAEITVTVDDNFDVKMEDVADGVYNDVNGNYYISNANGLKWVAEEVNKYSNYERPFEGETIYLLNDIDLGGEEWTPIGDYRFSANRFCGTFDGQGYTISNFKITKKTDKNDSNKSSYGFFGNLEGTVKNLTIANATVSSYAYTGALVGRLNSGLIENCHVINSAVSNTYWQGGILIGQVNGEGNNPKVKNCSVKNSSITSKSAIGAIAGPVTATEGTATFEECYVENCQVIQEGSFGGSYDNYFGSMFGYLEADANSRINVNNCSVENVTVKGNNNAPISGDFDGNIYINGGQAVSTDDELAAAITAGGNYTLANDIAMTQSVAISNANFVLDGNGKTITMTENWTNNIALFDITGGTATIKNVKFDGIKKGAVVRTVDTDFVLDNVVINNCNHTVDQGLLRLFGKSSIKNSTFSDNVCKMVISLNFDSDENWEQQPAEILNCNFVGNTCSATAVCYYADGSKAFIDGNKFVNNRLTVSNGATVYMGFKENCTITNNLFDGNRVTATSKRSSGGLMIGNAAVVTGNAFVNNTVTVNGQTGYGNDVCASPYYAPIDLSGNYWGGGAPVEGDDYYKEYNNYEVIINDYLTVNPFN